MGIVGIRELARRTSAIVSEVGRKREPALITRRGEPVAYLMPVNRDEFEDFVLANAPEFVEGMKLADTELRAGQTISLKNFLRELDSEEAVRS